MADISKIQLENATYDIKDTTARSDISTLSTSINNLEIDYNNKINNLRNNEQTITSLVTISDSYGVMDGVTNFPTYMKTYLSLDNDHFYNNSYGGTGFAHASDDKTFYTLLQECETNLSSERRSSVSHLLIAGGYNDQWSNDSDIQTGVINCVTLAHTLFPNALIYIAHIGWSRNNSDLEKTFRNYYEGTTLSKYGKFITNSQNILNGSLIGMDKVHPTVEGLQKLAKNLIEGLQTGCCYPASQFLFIDDNANNHLGVVKQDNDTIIFQLYSHEYQYTGTTDGTSISYKTLSDSSMITGHHSLSLKVPCIFVGNNGEYTYGYCNYKISQGVITLEPYSINVAGNGWFNFISIRLQDTLFMINHTLI